MGFINLCVIIGIFWMLCGGHKSKSQTSQHNQSNDDQEFEDMYFNGASGDDIDDF